MVPGKETRIDPVAAAPGIDDYRVLGLRALLRTLGAAHPARRAVVASAERAIAGRATRWQEPLAGTATAAGHALCAAAERHAVTLYRRAIDAGAADPADPAVEAALRQRGAGQRLPDALRDEMEHALGLSLAGVRVHTDDVAARAARALHAEAFTIGEDIFFAAGAFAPDTRAGRKLVAHELAHVAQALRGHAHAGSAGPRVSEPGELLEREADAVADRLDQGADPRTARAGSAALPRGTEDRAHAARPEATLRVGATTRPATRSAAILRSPTRPEPEPKEPRGDPRADPRYVDNLIESVGCALIVADRYTLRWSGGHALIFNDDIDWTRTSKALSVVGLAAGPATAKARAAEWNDVAISTGYDRAVAFYRGEGGAILPTWFSPETTPAIHRLILGVGRKVREEAHAVEDLARGLRNGMIIGALIGGALRLVFRFWPTGGGGGGGEPNASTAEPAIPEPAGGRDPESVGAGKPPETRDPSPHEPPAQKAPPEASDATKKPTKPARPPPSAADQRQQSVRSAAGNAGKRATAKHTFDAADRPAVEQKATAAARPAAERAYGEAVEAGKTPKQANAAANRAAAEAADRVARVEAENAAHTAAQRAIERGDAIDLTKLDTQSKAQLAEFEASKTGIEARRLSGELAGLSEKDFVAKMAGERCTTKAVPIGGPPPQTMRVYEYQDGTVVRYKPRGDAGRPGPTYSVEVKKNPGLPDLGKEDAAFKVDASGRPIPKGPFEVKNPYPPGTTQAQAFRQALMDAGHKPLETSQ